MHKEALAAIAFYFLALVACANAQQPPAPPVQWQYGWQPQPIATPGHYFYVPRFLPVLDNVFGPRYSFVPMGPPQPIVPQQPQQLAPPLQQGAPQQ